MFITLHLVVQSLAIFDLDWHIRATAMLRGAYRHPIGATLLLASLSAQALSGLKLLQIKRRDVLGPWQRFSGIALVSFLLVHVGAVHYARLQGTETDFHFAAAGFNTAAGSIFFGPYYFLGVFAFFLHVGIAWIRFSKRQGSDFVLRLVPFVLSGAALGIALVAALSGVA